MNLLELFGLKRSNGQPSFTRFKLAYGEVSQTPFYKVILESPEAETSLGSSDLKSLFEMVVTLLKASSTNYDVDYATLNHLFQNLQAFDLKVNYEIEYFVRPTKKPWHYKSTHFRLIPPSHSTVLLTDDTIDGLINKIDDSKNLISRLD